MNATPLPHHFKVPLNIPLEKETVKGAGGCVFARPNTKYACTNALGIFGVLPISLALLASSVVLFEASLGLKI